jgi:hypothetical protein
VTDDTRLAADTGGLAADTDRLAADTDGRTDRPLPPDPAAFDSPRARIARAKGLATPYIPGGRDPDPDAGLREERRYGKLLLAMVLALMFGGFVIGIAIVIAVGTVP